MESTNRQASCKARRGGGGYLNRRNRHNVNCGNSSSSVDISSLFCYHSNVDSLPNKFGEFCSSIKLLEREPDIIMLTEVLPKNCRFPLTKADISIDSYEIFPESFPLDMTRGTVIYIKKTFESS